MTLEKLRLKADLDGDGTYEREYDMYPVETVDGRSRKNAVSISPPGRPASENILLGVSGMQGDITLAFFAWDDGTDRANGTHTSTVTTVEEQITYLEDTMHAADFLAAWQLDHVTGSQFNDDEVFVESIEPTYLSQSSPKWKPVRMTLRRGGTV